MALKFNGTSIYSINYNNQDVLNLRYNGNSIWAKRYTDAEIYYISEINASLDVSYDNVGSISNYNLERISSLDASPSPFSYSGNNATVHWGDVFRAKGGTPAHSKAMYLPSGDNIQIDSDAVIYLSGVVSTAEGNAPKITVTSDGTGSWYYLRLSQFSQFGETYYKTFWNGVQNGEKASEFCRCWIQVLAMDYKGSSSSGYTINSLGLYKGINGASNYDSTIGGWVLSPSDFVKNTNNFNTMSTYDGIFKQRYFRISADGGSTPAAWRVITCYRNGWGSEGYTEIYGSTNASMPTNVIISGFNNSSLAAIDKVTDDVVAWVTAKPYANS